MYGGPYSTVSAIICPLDEIGSHARLKIWCLSACRFESDSGYVYTNWKSAANEERLRKAVAEATSIAKVCRLLGLADKGGNYRTLKHHITRLNLDVSHHTGSGWNRDNYSSPTSSSNKDTWKKHLIRTNGHRCEHCGLTTWQGRPIPLELDHINGKNNDNRLENLRILCCNCHALTPTWRNNKR